MELVTEWRFSKIQNYEDYIICDDGSAYSCKRGGKKLNLKPSKRKKYLRIRISLKGKEKYLWVHRTVAKYFVDGDIEGFEIHHIDRDTWNNHWNNLKKVTKRENLDYRNYDNGWTTKYY